MFGYLVWVREHRQVGIREIDRRDAEHGEFGEEDFTTEDTEITEKL